MSNITIFLILSASLVSCVHPSGTPRKPQSTLDDHSGHVMNMRAVELPAPDCDSVGWVKKVSPKHQAIINKLIGSRTHRLQHALWHSVRGGLDADQTAQVLSTWGNTWGQAHPLCPAPEKNFDDARYNASGEDFLFMHRQMLNATRTEYIKAGLQCVRGWDNVRDFKYYPVPGELTGPKTEEALGKFSSWDQYFHDPQWLKSVSLSQLGVAVEFTIHNNLHMRFAEDRPAEPFRGNTPEEDGAIVPFDGNFPQGWKFDEAGYNWLADPYGAAVNPTFWKIHGYVDNLINEWLKANNYSSVAMNCVKYKNCYTWRGTWIGQVGEGNRAKGRDKARAPQDPKERAKEDRVFLKNRMARFRIGVIEKNEGKNGGKAEGPRDRAKMKIEDPFLTAKARLCP